MTHCKCSVEQSSATPPSEDRLGNTGTDISPGQRSHVIHTRFPPPLGLTQAAPGSQENNQKVIDYLEGFGGILMGLVFETTASRYFAEIATSYGVDMESLMREGKPLSREAKEALMSQFEQGALKSGQNTWAQILRLEQAAPEQG